MTYLVVLPVISYETTDQCVEWMFRKNSSAHFERGNILLVDNTRDGGAAERYNLPTYRDEDGHQLGVARAWNIGARRVLRDGLDYLVILSSTVIFGPELHVTWTEEMERLDGNNVIEAIGHSWHLIAIHRRVFETIGLFDENFYPAYFESIDFGYRMRNAGMEAGPSWQRIWVNAMSLGSALHIHLVDCPAPPLLKYYRQKWGGDKGEERFTIPWNKHDISYWPERSIPELAQRYNLTNWW